MLSKVEREKCYEETDAAKAHRERTQKLIIPDAPDPHLHHSWECEDCLTPPPPPEHEEPRLIEVEQILSKQFVKDPQDHRLTITYYLVKWKDYEVRQASWEPSYNLIFGDSDSLPLVKEFEGRPNPEVYPKIRVYERDVHNPMSYTLGTSYNSASGWSLRKRFARRAYVPKFPNYVRTFPMGKEKDAHTYVGEFNCTRVSEYHDVRYPYGTHTDREPSYVHPSYPLSLRAAPESKGPRTG
ncbi:unnamed protein product [Calypogeia fissa]